MNDQNLKPFTGVDDPRRGKKPKGVEHSITRLRRLLMLTENLTNPITKAVEGFTVAEQMDLAQIIKARRGDTRAYNAILDRLEGKPRQTTELMGNLSIKGIGQLVDEMAENEPEEESESS